MNQNNISLKNVIKGLECCTQPSIECDSDCPYAKAKRNVWMTCCDVLMDDALALIKNLNEKLEETQRAYESALMIAPFYDDYMGW